MSPHMQNRNAPTRSCTVSGCGGTMIFRGRQEVASASAGSSGGTWVCDNNPAHVEDVSPSEEQAISGG